MDRPSINPKSVGLEDVKATYVVDLGGQKTTC
jgi:hypothetical protein